MFENNNNPLNQYIPTQNPFSQNYDNQGYINPPNDSNIQRGNFQKKPFEVEFYQEQGYSNFTGYNSRVQHGFSDLNYDYGNSQGYQNRNRISNERQNLNNYTQYQQSSNYRQNQQSQLNYQNQRMGQDQFSSQGNPSNNHYSQNTGYDFNKQDDDLGYFSMDNRRNYEPELTEEEMEEDRLLKEAFMN